MEEEKEGKDTKQRVPNSENYTILHALVEAMVNKEEKDSRRRRFLRKLRRVKNNLAYSVNHNIPAF